jgi:hypothetical protein
MSPPVITILNDVIERVTARQRIDDLSIQLDGASENWNKSLLCFAQLLVETGKVKNEVGIFRKFYITTLNIITIFLCNAQNVFLLSQV